MPLLREQKGSTMAKGTKSALSPIVAMALVVAAGTAQAQMVTSAASDDARSSFYVGTVGRPEVLPPLGMRSDEPKEPERKEVSSVMSYDEHFTFAVEDGCNYTASIRGTLRPVALGPEAYRKVEPDLALTAVLECPSADPQKVAEKVAGTGPITRTDLESLLERRASILSETGKRCSYVPDIAFVGEGLAGKSVAHLCPLTKDEPKAEKAKDAPAPTPKDER